MEIRKVIRAARLTWKDLLGVSGTRRVLVARRDNQAKIVLQVAKGQTPASFTSAATATLAAFSTANYGGSTIPLVVEVENRNSKEYVRASFTKRS